MDKPKEFNPNDPLPDISDEDQETLANDLLEPLERNLFAKQQDAANHHQIRRTIHPQPSGIDRRETFALGRSHRVRVNSAGARLTLRASSVSR